MSGSNELENYKKNIKETISNYLNNNQLKEAEELIAQYEKIIPADLEIYHAKSIISIQEGKYELAEKILKEAVHIDNYNSDTLYNLGYVYHMKNELEKSFKYYKLANEYTNDVNLKLELENVLKEINKIKPNISNSINSVETSKKVLMIAHIFPPIGGSGVQRTLKFAKYLKSFGWDPIVVTAGKTNYPLIDESLLAEIPDDTRIIRIDEDYSVNITILSEIHSLIDGMVTDKELYETYRKISTKQNEMVAIPDPYVLWANRVLKNINNYIDVSDIDLIYTTSGPYSDHIIGYYLKEEYKKPWIADFRDEWTNNPYGDPDKSSWLYKIQYELEDKIVHAADKIITVTPQSTINYQNIFKLDKEKVITITNGYDEEDFNGIDISSSINEKFTIVHNGLLYSIRTPITFMKAISNLIKSNKIDANKIKVRFSWTNNDEQWMNYAKELQLNNIIEFFGYVSHKESLQIATKADLLLLIVGPGEKNKDVYTGKVFEYLRLNKPILSLSPLNGAVDNLINQTNRGYNVDFDNVEAIEQSILNEYTRWLEGESSNFNVDSKIENYERNKLTEKLSVVFDSVFLNKIKKEKIVFFSIKNGDNFLNDIINALSQEYNVRKIIVTNYSQIDEGMRWADICWFEWCDNLLRYGSELEIAKKKKIICRLHRYEAFTENLSLINWDNVEKLVFVSRHIKEYVNKKINLPEEKLVVIPNGVNQQKFNFKQREKGYNLAVLGHLNMRKNPMIILQHFKELLKVDNNYKLYFAGDFTGDSEKGTLEWYLKYMVNKLELGNNVIFDGFIDNDKLPLWLENKNYILTGSIAEGHPVGIMEAMNCGLKPVIHGYPGVEDSYPREYIYYSLEEFINIITSDDYDSLEYKNYITENYTLESQMNLVLDVFKQMEETNQNTGKLFETTDDQPEKKVLDTNDVKEYYDDFLGYLKNDRVRPNHRHEYIKRRLNEVIKDGDKVLDLGCGIGITTEHISKQNVAKVIGVDLSPKLIEFARDSVKNIEFLIHDITTLKLNEKFDVISLCDVVEHIPRDLYPNLFKVIKEHLKENGQVFITIPDPDYNDFIRTHMPEKMQIIDNSVTFDEMHSLCRPNKLKVKYFNMYGIWLPNEYNEYILQFEDAGKSSWEQFHLKN